MSLTQPGAPEEPPAPRTAWSTRLRSIWPLVLTALVAVAASLALQALLQPTLQVAAPPPATLPVPAPTEAPTAPPAPTPTLPEPDERILSQEILDLRAELQSLRSAFYLMRAANQIADAEAALGVNNLAEAERVLVIARVSLDHAYDLSAEQEKGPIGEFRVQIGLIRNDLRVRPEGMDERLRRLRQDMLSLSD